MDSTVGMDLISTSGDMNTDIYSIAYDSRKVVKGSLFVAIRGLSRDGHDYLKDAAARGAAALVVEQIPAQGGPDGSASPVVLRVSDSRRALALLSSTFYHTPSRSISVTGITGTNGKTTTSYLLDSIIRGAGCKSGLIGTISYRIDGSEVPASHTTPESLDLQRLLRRMADNKTGFCVMEVSSHALALDRVTGVEFHTAVFTNLTQDHLDFHGDMENYRRTKEKLFLEHRPGTAVINADDRTGAGLVKKVSCPVLTYGLENSADIRGRIVAMTADEIRMEVESPSGRLDITSPLIGRHNAYNILAAIGAGISEGFSGDRIVKGITGCNRVPGRFEPVREGQPFTVLIDYAHTEDALENALKVVREVARGRVIVVFGCGGDRDRGKRSGMGAAAVRYADLTVITSDNPRTEDPARIIKEIEAGTGAGDTDCKTIIDRKEAITYAVSSAKEGDTVLIAGKGHEDYQIIGKTRIHFDDREIAREAIRAVVSSQ